MTKIHIRQKYNVLKLLLFTKIDYHSAKNPEKQPLEMITSMKHAVAQSPTSFCKKIRFHLLLKGTNASISRISRRLSKKFDLKSYKPANKLRLTSQMKKKRLEFAKKHID